jgi:hypothetical protein
MTNATVARRIRYLTTVEQIGESPGVPPEDMRPDAPIPTDIGRPLRPWELAHIRGSLEESADSDAHYFALESGTYEAGQWVERIRALGLWDSHGFTEFIVRYGYTREAGIGDVDIRGVGGPGDD